MITLLIVLHVIVCIFLIVIVLLQHGKGADIGATFGGSSQTLFGTEGPVPLLNKITTAAAIIFMMTSVALAYFSTNASTGSVMSALKKEQPANVEKTVDKKEAAVPTTVPAATPAPASTPSPVAPVATEKQGQPQGAAPVAPEQKTAPEGMKK